jgi:hypothetical protein
VIPIDERAEAVGIVALLRLPKAVRKAVVVLLSENPDDGHHGGYRNDISLHGA